MVNKTKTHDVRDNPPVNAWSILDRAGQREFPSADPTKLEIWGYTDAISYLPTETIKLHVHTSAKVFNVLIYRDGHKKTKVYEEKGVIGSHQKTPKNAYEIGCDWDDALSIDIPKSWQTGFYVIDLSIEDTAGGRIHREAFFVLRSAHRGDVNKLAFLLSTASYTAYNDWGGANHYRRSTNRKPQDLGSPILSMRRPMARGFIRLPIGAPRYSEHAIKTPFEMTRYPWLEWALAYEYSRHYPDTGWASYDGPFVKWAEAEGYDFDFLTQSDLHSEPDCLAGYKAVIIVGHDEYWSWQMRDAVDEFVKKGGNLARFAGNYLWQIRLDEIAGTQTCYKMACEDPYFHGPDKHLTTTYWDSKIVGRLSTETIGLTGLGGVYARFGNCSPRSSGGFTVYRPEHWAFQGTGLYYGDQFGGAPAAVVSFEVDGLDYTFRDGLPYPTHKDGAPESLEIIAMSPTGGMFEKDEAGQILNAPKIELDGLFESAPAMYPVSEADLTRGSSMIGVCKKGSGEIFNAGCCEWVSGLIKKDFFVEQVTRNVLDRYLAK